MTPQQWKIVGSFGLLTAALSLYDPGFAAKVVALAALVVVVRHPATIEKLLGEKPNV